MHPILTIPTPKAGCIKGIRGAPDLTYNPRRLLHPQRRVGGRGSGRWERITRDEALDEIADRFADVRARFGPEAIAGATSGANFSRSLIVALMMRSIGSPNWMINQDLCGGCRAVSDSRPVGFHPISKFCTALSFACPLRSSCGRSARIPTRSGQALGDGGPRATTRP